MCSNSARYDQTRVMIERADPNCGIILLRFIEVILCVLAFQNGTVIAIFTTSCFDFFISG